MNVSKFAEDNGVAVLCMGCQKRIPGTVIEARKNRKLFWAEYTYRGMEVTEGPFCFKCWYKDTPLGHLIGDDV